MIFHHKLTTKAGTFSYISTQKLTSPHINLLFFTAMGIGCSYFDFYGLVNELPQTINCLCVDLLGSGSSSQPHNLKRNSQNIVQEITIFLNQLPLNEVYLCCHSFSSLYLLATLHQATLNTNIKGFISIDPTTVEIMKSYTDPFQDSLEEAQTNRQLKAQRQSIIPDADINPLLPADLATRCQKLYTDLSGSTTEIAELKAAPQTLESMKNLQLPDETSALSFISSLNAAGYEQYGNPYFNQNPYSIQIKLNGHHFLHWLHPKLMAQFIANYLVQSEKINPA